jgi:hypothetical protein
MSSTMIEAGAGRRVPLSRRSAIRMGAVAALASIGAGLLSSAPSRRSDGPDADAEHAGAHGTGHPGLHTDVHPP